jgi:hypothetical protein
MRSDVHFAALKAAARVAFSVALPAATVLTGCSSAGGLLGEEESDDAVSNESAIAANASNAAGSRPKRSLGKKPCPTTTEDAGPAKPSCEATLAATFPTPGDYQWEPVAQSKEVVACCDEELTKNGASSAYRWDCCVAYDPAATPDPNSGFTNSSHGMACTPWGPPVPPSMKRSRRPSPALSAFLNAAVA